MLNYLALIEQFSYLAVVIILILNGIFLPVPDEVILLIAGYLVSLDLVNLYAMFVSVVLGLLIGDYIGYALGRMYGLFVIKKVLKFLRIGESKLKYTEDFFRSHGGKAIFLARFLPGIRILIPILAGSHKMKYRNFLLWNLLGILVGVPIYMAIGYLFGSQFDVAFKEAKTVKHILFAIAITILGFLLVRRLKNGKKILKEKP